MKILAAPNEAETVVQRSQFLSLLIPLSTQEEARSTLKTLKERYSDATHVVHAFCVGLTNSQIQGCSDDGEPSGTAGRPVLDVLKGSGGTNAFLAVVRWFGGTKLGTGGLVKAYTAAAQAVVSTARWELFVARERLAFRLEFSEHGKFLKWAETFDAKIERSAFNDGVEIEASVVADRLDEFKVRLRDLTNGRLFSNADLES